MELLQSHQLVAMPAIYSVAYELETASILLQQLVPWYVLTNDQSSCAVSKLHSDQAVGSSMRKARVVTVSKVT